MNKMTKRVRQQQWVRRCLGAVLLSLALCAPALAQPYTDTEVRSIETQDEAKVREIRSQEINQLRIALGRRLQHNRQADLYFRLAEIYVEAYRMEFILEGRAHEKRLENGSKEKFIDRTRSKPYLSLGIKACKDLLALNVPYNKIDQVYYFMGFNATELGQEKEAQRYFLTLIQKYPSSPFAGDAYRELGDAQYAINQYRKASGYYEQALARAPKDLKPRILHKLAWCYYRTRQLDRAIAMLKEAIALSAQSGEKFLATREEALRDMAIFMTENGQVDQAISYFQSAAGDKAFYPRVLERLGKQYERNVEPLKAAQVYESLLKTNPDSEAAFRVTVKLVDLELRRAKYKEANARINAAKIPSKGEEGETLTAYQNLKAMVRRTATEKHEDYRKKGNRQSLETAEMFYQTYLKVFLARDDARQETPEIQMYLAEVKRDLGKSKEASELYRLVVDSRDKRYAKEAGVLWTASLSEAIKRDGSKSSTTPANSAAPKADPSTMEREFVDAADKLQDALGDTSDGREYALKSAQVLAGYKKTQSEAIERARKIIAKNPKSPQALTAARLWLQTLSDKVPQNITAASTLTPEQSDAADALKDSVKELEKNAPLMSADKEAGGKLKAQMTEQSLRLKVINIARSEREKNYMAAAQGYEALASDPATPKDLVERASLNAVTTYQKTGNIEALDRSLTAWMKRYPKHPKQSELVRGIATQHIVAGRFDLAAKYFELLGREAGDAEALQTAARIYDGSGDSLRAQQAWAGYLRQFPNGQHRWSVALTLGKAQEALGQDADAAKAYKYCLEGPAEYEAECGSRLGDLYLKLQDVNNARPAFKRVASQKAKRGEASSPYVGYAHFRLAELLEKEARFEALALPEAQLKKALAQRMAFLEPLSKAYTAAVEAGGPWGMAALDRLAQWVVRFADDVDQIAPTPNAAPQAIENFRKSLKSVSDPLRKKALSVWADAYNKASNFEVLSPIIPAIADRLADLNAPVPMRAQGARPAFRLAGVPSDGGVDGESAALQKVRDRLNKNLQDATAWSDYGNLLWGGGKPVLAALAYERALAIQPKNAVALNNRAVALMGGNPEDWNKAAEGNAFLTQAVQADEFFLVPKMNRAMLLNYYRIFGKAKNLWLQVLAKSQSAEAFDGLAVAMQGLGSTQEILPNFKKATELGLPGARFARAYNEAARMSADNNKCISELESLDVTKLQGFEKIAYDNLMRFCKYGTK